MALPVLGQSARLSQSPPPSKRQRMSRGLPTPPTSDASSPVLESDINRKEHAETPSSRRISSLDLATHVLATEAAALLDISQLYKNDHNARASLQSVLDHILASQNRRGKVLFCGVGKSAYIAQKLTATCKSLGVRASFLHACEAVHGDLGDIGSDDILLFVSFSGRTPELMNLLQHVPVDVPVVAMTAHRKVDECPLLAGRRRGLLLPASIPEREEESFGLSAPTTSTTVALAVGDMLALTLADQLHGDKTKDVFKKNHPGGTIGMTHKELEQVKGDGVDVSIVELPSPS